MIYTVTLNPSLDYFASCEGFEIGKTNRTSKELIYPGGKGINVSKVLMNLGLDSIALGFLAGFSGEHISRLLKDWQIKEQMIFVKEGFSRINVKIRSLEETELNGQGPKIDDQSLEQFFNLLNNLSKGDVLVLSGSIPSSLPKGIYEEILRRTLDKQPLCVVDCTGDSLLNALKYHPFLIKPNVSELEGLFNVTIGSRADSIVYAKKLKEMGAVNVLVSFGGDGALLLDEFGNVHEMDVPQGVLVNSVGSGDSMVAGFIYAYLLSGDYGKAFKYSVAAGSASAFKDDFASKEEIESLVAKEDRI